METTITNRSWREPQSEPEYQFNFINSRPRMEGVCGIAIAVALLAIVISVGVVVVAWQALSPSPAVTTDATSALEANGQPVEPEPATTEPTPAAPDGSGQPDLGVPAPEPPENAPPPDSPLTELEPALESESSAVGPYLEGSSEAPLDDPAPSDDLPPADPVEVQEVPKVGSDGAPTGAGSPEIDSEAASSLLPKALPFQSYHWKLRRHAHEGRGLLP